jgi:hypothetical protein
MLDYFHFVRERYLAQELEIEHIASTSNIANICTKAKPLPLLTSMKDMLKIIFGGG